MREARVVCIRPIFIPGFAIVESRWLSPPICPRNRVFPFSEQCSFCYTLEEYAEIKIVVFGSQVNAIAKSWRKCAEIYQVTLRCNLPIAIHIFEHGISQINITRHALQVSVCITLLL